MKSLLIAAALSAALPFPSFAANVTGLIGNVDAFSRTVTLWDGQTYRLPQSVQPAAFRVGDGVAIEYSADVNGLLVASVITLHSRPWYTRRSASPRAGA
jgi:hypothetical protein